MESSTPPKSRAASPKSIVASWCGEPVRSERILERNGWGQVSAIRHGHVYEIKSPYILQPRSASLTGGVRMLHDCIARAAT